MARAPLLRTPELGTASDAARHQPPVRDQAPQRPGGERVHLLFLEGAVDAALVVQQHAPPEHRGELARHAVVDRPARLGAPQGYERTQGIDGPFRPCFGGAGELPD